MEVTEQVKAITGGLKMLPNGNVGGYAVKFGDPDNTDLALEYFTAQTDFGLREGKRSDIPVYYQHGMDKAIKRDRFGWGELTQDEVGIWFEAQLELSNKYREAVMQLAEQGRLGLSSGTMDHLWEREATGKATWIKSWPISEVSLTPTPAEPRTQVVPIKAYEEMLTTTTEPDAGDSLKSEALKNESSEGEARVSEPKQTTIQGVQIMDNEVQAPETTPAEETVKANGGNSFDELNTKVDALSQVINDLMKRVEEDPAVRKSGYYTVDGGTADPSVKSWGDYLLAVKRGDKKRIYQVYGSTKDLSEGTGGAGGYLVPEGYSNDFITGMFRESQILSKVQRVPVTQPMGHVMALDMFAAPTAGAGNNALAGGVVATTTAEGATLTETEPGFEEITYRVRKIGGFTQASDEVVQDSVLSIDSLLRQYFQIAVTSKMERHILLGSGAGEPLGIMNAAAAIGVTPASNGVFGEADALTMYSRLIDFANPASTCWVIHPSIIPDYAGFTASNADLVDWNQSIRNSLLGMPVHMSGHMAQANANAVLLADLNKYYLFELGGLRIGYSEDFAFTSEVGTWRFSVRMDGQPAFKSAITLPGPGSAFTVSPFVYHNDA